MKINRYTIEILKNLAAITQTGIVFPEGNTIRVQDGSGIGAGSQRGQTMLAVAVLNETITDQFAVHDPNQLYSCLTMFEEPDIEVETNTITITDGTNPKAGRFSLTKASPTVVKEPGQIAFPEADDNVSFQMTAEMYDRLFRGVGIVSTPEIAIVGDGSDLMCSAHNSKNPTSDRYSVTIGITALKFQSILKIESINKLMKKIDYVVTLSPRGIIRFKSLDPDYNITYYIAAQCTTN